MYKDEMTFTVSAYGKSVTITVSDDIDIHTFLDTCRHLAITTGYHENNWKDGVIEMANDYLHEEEMEVEKNLEDFGGYTQAKVYTGKSDLITHWGKIPPSNC